MTKANLNSSTSLSSSSANIQKSKSEKTAERIKSLTSDRGNLRRGWSIKEWCAIVGISPNTFYRMSVELRPLVIEIGGKHMITLGAHEEWERQCLARARAMRDAPEAPDGATA
jgi:hypothetical protein